MEFKFIYIGNIIPENDCVEVINKNPGVTVPADNQFALNALSSIEKIGDVINISIKVNSDNNKINQKNYYLLDDKIPTWTINNSNSNVAIKQFILAFRKRGQV